MKELSQLDERELRQLAGVARSGRVTEVVGTLVRAVLPEARVGEICRIRRSEGPELEAEVVGFDRDGVYLVPFGDIGAIESNAAVRPTGRKDAVVPCGAGVRGRVLDATGRPIDGGPPLDGEELAPLHAPPPDPLTRVPIREALSTGIRAIDGLLTVGRGQRVGIFAAAGGGKSTLLGMITRNIEADLVVLALIGERGREVRGFLEDDLGELGRARSVVVVSTSDQPALLRLRAAYTATAIAEAARAAGQHVVLLMDSVTRFARALREIGLATGEPPGRQGFPASVYATLPKLFERAGTAARGSITAFYTVLVAGDDLEEPVADETMSLLDGHLILSRRLAERQHYPAIDVLRSKSRVMGALVDGGHGELARRIKAALSVHEENREKIAMKLYDPPNEADRLRVAMNGSILAFLAQRVDEAVPLAETVDRMRAQLGALPPIDG